MFRGAQVVKVIKQIILRALLKVITRQVYKLIKPSQISKD